jgi:GT2 family glycosyltransferase
MTKFSLIIPTWNGRNLLEKNLPKVIAAIEVKKTEIVVIDNGSTDGSAAYLKTLLSSRTMNRLIALKKNFGFSYAVNLGVKKAKGEIVVLLNNDVVPEKNFLSPLKKLFSDPQVFAVSLHEPQFSWARGEFKDGFLFHEPGPKTKKTHPSLWASGGSAAFRKSTWQELGGLDDLYRPFYWEDLDLGYRALKRGYQILWEPGSVVHHRHEATVSRFPKKYVDLIKQRNELLFIWKNITSQKMFFEHKKYLVKRIMKNPGYLKIFLAALAKLNQVIARRQEEIIAAKLTDEEVFKKFS